MCFDCKILILFGRCLFQLVTSNCCGFQLPTALRCCCWPIFVGNMSPSFAAQDHTSGWIPLRPHCNLTSLKMILRVRGIILLISPDGRSLQAGELLQSIQRLLCFEDHIISHWFNDKNAQETHGISPWYFMVASTFQSHPLNQFMKSLTHRIHVWYIC
jgi:hypothetical protein